MFVGEWHTYSECGVHISKTWCEGLSFCLRDVSESRVGWGEGQQEPIPHERFTLVLSIQIDEKVGIFTWEQELIWQNVNFCGVYMENLSMGLHFKL